MSIEEKKRIRKARPTFLRSEGNQIKRISRSGYRRPKGLHNKMKDAVRGHRKTISVGFGYPKETRGRDNLGRLLLVVKTVAELADVPKDAAIIVSSTLGTKKRITLLKKAVELKIPIHKIADATGKATELQTAFDTRKKEATKKNDARKSKQAAVLDSKSKKSDNSAKQAAPATKKTTQSTETKTDADAKAQEKKEHDKVLINKKE